MMHDGWEVGIQIKQLGSSTELTASGMPKGLTALAPVNYMLLSLTQFRVLQFLGSKSTKTRPFQVLKGRTFAPKTQVDLTIVTLPLSNSK